MLRGALPTWIELATFELEDAETVILSSAAVRSGLDAFPATRDAVALVAEVRDGGIPVCRIVDQGVADSVARVDTRVDHFENPG